MMLLLNENTNMNGASGDVEREGMSVDVDGSEVMGINVDIGEFKENMVFGDEVRGKGIGLGDTGVR
jgi:hypothetical protein